MTRPLAVLAVLAASLVPAAPAEAQPLGTFRWQLQPYCNVVTVSLTQNGAVYTLDGHDDQCGAARRAPLVGLATPNPDGTIGFGMTMVTAPGGVPVHVAAAISLATLGGTWRDSVGNTGNFVFTPGAGAGGSPRPVPSSGIAPTSITLAELAPDAVTGAVVANGSLTSADLADGPRAAFVSGNQQVSLTPTTVVVRSVTLSVPANGSVLASASGYFTFNDPTTVLEFARCSITTSTAIDLSHLIAQSDTSPSTQYSAFGATRGFAATPGTMTINLVCDEQGGNILLFDTSLTATFVPG